MFHPSRPLKCHLPMKACTKTLRRTLKDEMFRDEPLNGGCLLFNTFTTHKQLQLIKTLAFISQTCSTMPCRIG